MNQKLALNVVAYIADHLGNLLDDSVSEFKITQMMKLMLL